MPRRLYVFRPACFQSFAIYTQIPWLISIVRTALGNFNWCSYRTWSCALAKRTSNSCCHFRICWFVAIYGFLLLLYRIVASDPLPNLPNWALRSPIKIRYTDVFIVHIRTICMHVKHMHVHCRGLIKLETFAAGHELISNIGSKYTCNQHLSVQNIIYWSWSSKL